MNLPHSYIQSLSRRSFVKLGASGLLYPFLNSFQTKPSKDDPHFFLFVFFPGGLDPTYMFDARPLAMTQAGLLQNYTHQEPFVWQGSNANTCLASELVRGLYPLKDYFTILNGVVMSPSDDGHEQNQACWLTQSPFGGRVLWNDFSQKSLLQLVELGERVLTGGSTSSERATSLTTQGLSTIARFLNESKITDPSHPASTLINSQLGQLSRVEKRGLGFQSENLLQHWRQSHNVASKLKNIDIPEGDEPLMQQLETCRQLFTQGLSHAATLVFDTDLSENFDLDVHSGVDAKLLPDSIREKIVPSIHTILDYLRETPFDNKRSMLDVTTFIVTSEFARTMRQSKVPFEDTGTDHNPLTNTVLLGGKGIKTGYVLGESDLQTPDEQLSSAHAQFDPEAFKIMGRPFDFQNSRNFSLTTQSYDSRQYLSFNSVLRTLYEVFKITLPSDRAGEQIGTHPVIKILS
jgi:hypothetical protein